MKNFKINLKTIVAIVTCFVVFTMFTGCDDLYDLYPEATMPGDDETSAMQGNG